jgi:RNA polymerase sigma-70 factor (ECF subfamily)
MNLRLARRLIQQMPRVEPYPDALLAGIPERPGTRYDVRASIELNFVQGLQELDPRVRAVLLLHDVLGFCAREVAGILDADEAWVRDVLGCARIAMDECRPGPASPRERELVAEFVAAYECDGFRLIPTRANGRPAFACYLRDPDAPVLRARGLLVLTLSGDEITAIDGFPDTSLLRFFGLPLTMRA